MIAWLALLFSFMAPGAGHLLTGHSTQAVVLGVLFCLGKNVFLPLSLRLFRVHRLETMLRFFYACNWCYIGLIFYAALSAFWLGLRNQELHWVAAFLFALAVVSVYKNTKNKFIFSALCGNNHAWDTLCQMHKTPTRKN